MARKARMRIEEAETEGAMEPAPAGHNSQGALIRRHFGLVRAAQEEAASANARYRNTLKAAEADGLEPKQLKEMLLAVKQDPKVVVHGMKTKIVYMAALNIPVTWQELFDQAAAPPANDGAALTQDQLDARIWDADDEGYNASRSGMSIDDNRHSPGTAEYAAWRSGWHRQQAIAGSAVTGSEQDETVAEAAVDDAVGTSQSDEDGALEGE